MDIELAQRPFLDALSLRKTQREAYVIQREPTPRAALPTHTMRYGIAYRRLLAVSSWYWVLVSVLKNKHRQTHVGDIGRAGCHIYIHTTIFLEDPLYNCMW